MFAEQAHQFLSRLQNAISHELPPREEVVERIEVLKEEGGPHANYRENGFLGEYVVPALHQELTELTDSEQAATEALRFESYRHFERVADSPVRSTPVPFAKQPLDEGVEGHLERWWPEEHEAGDEGSSIPGKQAPDMGIVEPAPHSVVFEAKYVRDTNLRRNDPLAHAREILVKSTHEAFHYRSLPNLGVDADGGPWSFDYGCLIAYDATEMGLLRKAWEQFDEEVREGFWTGLGTEIMLLGDQ